MRWQRIVRKVLTTLGMVVVASTAAGPAAAAPLPMPGANVQGALEIGPGRQVPLPPGRFLVGTAFEESAALDNGRSVAVQVLVLANDEPSADVPLLVLEFTSYASVNWNGQPCDNPPGSNPPLNTQAFGTTTTSLTIRCNRVHAFANLRMAVRDAAAHRAEWIRKRWSAISARSPRMPADALVVHGYLAATAGDRLQYWAYLNPEVRGLGGSAAAPAEFRRAASGDGSATRIGAYLRAVAAWGEAYTMVIERQFLTGRGSGTAGPGPVIFDAGAGAASVAGGPASAPAAPLPSQPSERAPPATTVALAPPSDRAPPPSPGVAAPTQLVHALVIGNSAYGGAPLANPRHDAEAVAERFRRFGFQVTLVLDANRSRLVQALTAFSDSARAADVGIVYYAGHGMQINGSNYLLPIDLDISGRRSVSIPLEAVSLESVLQDHLPGRTRLVFLDACRDNPLSRSLAGHRGASSGLAPIHTVGGTLISYATRDGATADDGAGRHSPYTQSLLEHLDAPVDIALVLRRVREQVLARTQGRQEPWEYGSLIGGELVLSRIAARSGR